MSKKSISATVDEEVVEAITRTAKAEDRTVNAQVGRILREWVVKNDAAVPATQDKNPLPDEV